jgi:hypothetical protein
MERFLDIISISANVIEVGSFIVVIFLILQARRQLHRYLNARAEQSSEHPWILAVGIGGDILGQVKHYMTNHGLEKFPIENYQREGLVPPEKFYEVLRDMLKIKTKLSQAGVSEIHLFYRGPVTLAMGIGSIFDNWVPVKIYEYDQGTYRLDFVLEKGSVLGLLSTDPDSSIGEIFNK